MKNLDDLLSIYKNFSLATSSDNDELLAFFKTMTMETKTFSLRYDRGEDFFDFSRVQSDKTFTFLIKNEDKKIMGCASIALIPHLLNQKQELCAYLGDLRISPQLGAKIRIQWKKFYGDLIKNFNQMEEFKGVKVLYSAILEENQNAMRSLLKNNDQIIYHELARYESVNIFAKKWRANKSTTDFYIDRNCELTEVRSFLAVHAQNKGLQNHIVDDNSNDDELKRRLLNWKGLGPDSFICIKNKDNQIVSLCAPWKSDSKELVIERMSLPLKILGKLLFYFKIPTIKEHGPLKVLYMTHLTIDDSLDSRQRNEAMTLMINETFNRPKRDFHLITFFSWPQWELFDLPFFQQRTKARFYQVMNREQFENAKQIDLEGHVPYFDPGIA